MTNIPMTGFMIDFMYILAPPSPLNKVHLKVRAWYFVKYMCFFKICTYVLSIIDSKKKKKMIVNVIMSAFFPQIRLPFSLSIFLNPLRQSQTNIWLYFLQKRCKQKHCNFNRGCLAPLSAGQ